MAIAFSRQDWGAREVSIPQDSTRKFRLGVHHTDDENRMWTPAQERQKMREIQAFHMDVRGWDDISYSWVIFPSARAYTGRGFHGLPAAAKLANSGSWAIAFVGTHTTHEPSRDARLKLHEFIIRLDEFSDHFLSQLGGHREFPNQSTQCPGNALIEVVKRNRERFDLVKPQ